MTTIKPGPGTADPQLVKRSADLRELKPTPYSPEVMERIKRAVDPQGAGAPSEVAERIAPKGSPR